MSNMANVKLLTLIGVAMAANASSISQTFYHPPGSPGASNCTLSSECANSNLDPNGAPTDTFNVLGFLNPTLAIPGGSTLNSVTVTTYNFMVVNSVLVNDNGNSGTYDVYGQDTSKLSLNSNGSSPFYQDVLDTEEVFVTVPADTDPGETVNLWANDGGPLNALFGSNSADQETGGCDFSPNPTGGNCTDYDNYKHGSAVTAVSNTPFNSSGAVPIYWTDSTSNVASTSNLTSTNPTQYTGVEIVVTYDYTDPPSVPEPATFALIGAALIGLASLRRRKA